jgi:cell division protein ZipA
MDTDILRLVLFILGVAFVAGIYFWDKRKHVDSRLAHKQVSRKARRHDSTVFDQAEYRDPVLEPQIESESQSEVSSKPLHETTLELEPEAVETTVPVSDELSFSAQIDDVPVDDSLSFSSTDAFQEFEAGADLPTKILQVNLVMRNGEISGQMILDLALELDLQLGEFNIFHRMDKRTGKSVFSMANIVEPGSFDKTNMDAFRTPGLTLFSQLPAPIDCLKVYSEMINVAKRISYIVGAEIQDSTHSVMTSQSIEHEREAVIQYKHQLQLAMQSL